MSVVRIRPQAPLIPFSYPCVGGRGRAFANDRTCSNPSAPRACNDAQIGGEAACRACRRHVRRRLCPTPDFGDRFRPPVVSRRVSLGLRGGVKPREVPFNSRACPATGGAWLVSRTFVVRREAQSERKTPQGKNLLTPSRGIAKGTRPRNSITGGKTLPVRRLGENAPSPPECTYYGQARRNGSA